MKFRLLAAASIIVLTLGAFFLRFYASTGAKTTGGEVSCACGYLLYVDSFLYIDINGKILYIKKEPSDSLPLVEGIKFSRFSVGGYLESGAKETFNAMAGLMKLFAKYDLGDGYIVKMDVSSLDDIHLYTKNVDISFGSIKDADEKARTLKEIMANLRVAEDIKGLLDIRVIGQRYIFTVLT